MTVLSCAISGHRVLKQQFDKIKLAQQLNNLILQNYLTFYVGMARGFDLECVEALLNLKRTHKIEIIACIPCLGQEKYYSFYEKKAYYNAIAHCDRVEILNEKYITGCMQMRNRFMVDNCHTVFTYLYKSSGGTAYTVKYAQNCGKNIIYFKE